MIQYFQGNLLLQGNLKPRLLSIKTFKCIVLSLYLDNLIVKTCHASKLEY